MESIIDSMYIFYMMPITMLIMITMMLMLVSVVLNNLGGDWDKGALSQNGSKIPAGHRSYSIFIHHIWYALSLKLRTTYNYPTTGVVLGAQQIAAMLFLIVAIACRLPICAV